VSLRQNPVQGTATLPDGRVVDVRVGVPQDDYVPADEQTTVALTVAWQHDGHEHVLAALNTVLAPEHEAEAEELVRGILVALSSGEVEPDAGGLERFADTVPGVRDAS
jgi:hypothetical protein